MTEATLTLYSRGYCHLCEDMLAAVQQLQREQPFGLVVIDIDTEAGPALLAQYDEWVPVLLGEEAGAPPLCRHFFDADTVRAYLQAKRH